ncbi:MAG: DNA cytosine methyltransferase [Pseudomonadota bacterium]
MITHLDLFSGIGGFSPGLQETGKFKTIAHAEVAPFPSKVLARHWPNVPNLGDVEKADFPHADFITAGFPCHDISNAGKRAGITGERSGLFREVVRAIRMARPICTLLENVAALLGRGMGNVLGDLAEIGNDAEWDCIPSCYVGAWHERDRIWILTYPGCERDGQRQPTQSVFRQSDLSRQPSRVFAKWPGRSNLPAPTLHRGANGLSAELDSHGNAIIPQIAEAWGHAVAREFFPHA